ncbi:hypothetical protein G7Y89_g7313 [Cudoniella acicularis]|uniref:Ankyrin n=1 Tax=Cudoniella acicularis TaxID=354080 RepID=A0A8H4RLG2_9HELO|nr:hypothetical protein G7Y89_g7313 [Cudoniella acicularis]
MAPAGPGGRPRNGWTSSRRRKLARLYVLTNLSNDEIEKVLEARDFNPKSRDIQERRRSLFSIDFGKRYREYRPRDRREMKMRTTIIRQSENHRISKTSRYKKSHQKSRLVVRQSRSLITGTSFDPGTAFRNYADAQAPMHLEALSDSQPTNSWSLMLDGSSVSSRSTLSTTHHVTFQSRTSMSEEFQQPATIIPKVLEEGSFEKNNESHLNIDRVNFGGVETSILDQIPQPPSPSLAAPVSQISETADRDSKTQSADSLARLARRLSARSPEYIQHVYSILRFSMTDSSRSSLSHGSTRSWRSSWMSFTSEKSRNSEPSHVLDISYPLGTGETSGSQLAAIGDSYFTRARFRASKGERQIWEEIFDETQLLPSFDQRPDYQEMSLAHRKCCGLDDLRTIPCEHCGFDRIHAWARRGPDWASFPLALDENLNIVDHYGNTPLHYAAASGKATSTSILSMIERGADVHLRNSSHQTFLHVLCETGSIFTNDIEDFALLNTLKVLQFPFSGQDYHGRAIGHSANASLFPNILYYELIDRSQIGSTLDNQGFKLAGVVTPINFKHTLESINVVLTSTNSISLISAWFVSKIDSRGDTPLTALLKRWEDDEGQQAGLHEMVTKLISVGAVVDMRDRKGYTALAIAAIRGTRPCVKALLDAGASPNSRSYDGKGIIFQALSRMRDAKRENNDAAYARILSCVNLLVDHEAKLEPTERDEWLLPSPKAATVSADKSRGLSPSKRRKFFNGIRGKDK